MTQENHNKATELFKKIEVTKEAIKRWEGCKELKAHIDCERTMEGWERVSSKYIPFDVIKVLSLDGFRKQLASLEQELSSL